jgi:5'-nucleotidase (lipoprotein e(P4) family)
VEQAGMKADVLARLPTAVILDLDETVLDNTVFQARLLHDRAVYNAQNWGDWVMAGEAEALPGAREFIAAARRLGHTVFFITNPRLQDPGATATDPCPAKTATMRNLVELGIDAAPDPAHMLVRNERPEWNTGTKTHRRAFIAANYRIVALVGDDLGDFVDTEACSRATANGSSRASARAGSCCRIPSTVPGSAPTTRSRKNSPGCTSARRCSNCRAVVPGKAATKCASAAGTSSTS